MDANVDLSTLNINVRFARRNSWLQLHNGNACLFASHTSSSPATEPSEQHF
jgi:hypothetical protein